VTQSQGGPPQTYGLFCVRCGSALGLPEDLLVLMIDCPFCGQDNLLPPALVEVRRAQHAQLLGAEAREAQRAAQQRVLAERRASSSRTTRFILLGVAVVVGLPVLGFVALIAFGFSLQKDNDEARARASRPEINGLLQVTALLTEKTNQGCSRILLQPKPVFEVSRSEQKTEIGLGMIKGGACVHLLVATGAPGATVKLTELDSLPLSRPLPLPAPSLDYRLCASETAELRFSAGTGSEEPLTVAVVECPRLPGERLPNVVVDPTLTNQLLPDKPKARLDAGSKLPARSRPASSVGDASAPLGTSGADAGVRSQASPSRVKSSTAR